MGWIKRNLFFVVGGALTVILLGGAGFFIYQNWTRNSEASDRLNEIYGKLGELAQTQPQPGNEKTDNTQRAKDQQKEMADWMASAGKNFSPIAAIPPMVPVPSSAFADALRQTIDTLRREADGGSVTLPPQYDFSFSAQRQLLKFSSGSLEPLAVQLGEVKAIAEVLFAGRVNNLDSIQRVRVSDDDSQSAQADYIDQHPVTNDLAIITPYVITFRTFTPELARVISGFATSANPFIVKSVTVQPADMAGMAGGTPGMPAPGMYPPPGISDRYAPPPGMYPQQPGVYPGMPGQPVPGQPVPGKGGLQTVLKEQLLRVTLEVEVVKMLPKS